MEIAADSGAVLYSADGEQVGLPPGIEDRRRLQFLFRELPLAAGEYRVVVSACDRSGGRPWHTDAATRFVVSGGRAAAPLVARVSAEDVT